jgi:hypothetical protein
MTESEERFARRAVRRKRLFLGMSIAALVVAASLTILYAVWWYLDRAFAVGPRAVIILLVLLNARQQLRQYKYATILERLLPPPPPS